MNCPRCGRPGKKLPSGYWWCEWHQMAFDDDPEEGGPSHNDPAKAAERKEEYELRRRQPKPRRIDR